ncbi:hypothetical protein GGF31_000648 [Allomyces arbusculus]|nr:hypothetical protein GGF31_000648 [Allomyces arbusculus]
MALGRFSNATMRPSPLVRRVMEILAPKFTPTRLYARADELANARPRAHKAVLDAAKAVDAARNNLLEMMTDLLAGAQFLAAEHAVAINVDLVAAITEIMREQDELNAKHTDIMRPFYVNAAAIVQAVEIWDDLGEDNDDDARAAERAPRAEERERRDGA